MMNYGSGFGMFSSGGSGGGASSNSVLIELFSTSGTNLADSDDYFLTVGTGLGNTVNSQPLFRLPAGTLVGYTISTYVGSTFASSENSTVSLVWDGGLSEEVLSSTVKFDARNNTYTGSKSVAITDSDGWVRIDTPVFTTNPLAVRVIVTLTIDI